MLLLGLRQRALEQVPGHRRARERAPRTLRPWTRDPPAVAHVRRLCVRVGADPGRRARALSGRQAALAAELALRGVGRLPEVEPLRLVAAQPAHERVLLGGLDALGHEVELQGMTEVDDALEKHEIAVLGPGVRAEAPIDLYDVDREHPEIRVRRVAGPEVVER